jgi:single-strand DNA-binding protein
MKMAFNRVILVGNMVADPELKTTPNGVSVTRFRIAVNRRFAKNGETDFFDIVAWRQTAEFVNRFFTKGKQILVSGTLQNRVWTDNNGDKHRSTEIVADEVSFVDRKTERDNDAEPPAYGDTNSFEELSNDDELPF